MCSPVTNIVFIFPNLLQKRDPVLDRKRCELVVKAFQNHVNSKRPAKLPNKWHVWKYVEADQRRKAVQFDWMKMGRDTSEEVGWGRRIYEKTEIEVL